VAHAISFMHAADRRPVFVFPWEGATVIGTTDLDHHESLDTDARISAEEVDYLLAACAQQFPSARVGRSDVLSSWAGVRPVVSEGDDSLAPSDEKREHMLWIEPGCVTLAGGKLTTFRLLALEMLQACSAFVGKPVEDHGQAVFREVPVVALPGLSATQQRRLRGRHGRALPQLAGLLEEVGNQPVGSLDTLWAELAQACDNELVLHLDDLLLRRTRIGLLLAEGAAAELPQIRRLCQPRLGWSDARWDDEQQRYLTLWQRCYSLPEQASR
jgi:glycerol-3-phosphate dehydrogenase